MVGQWGRRREGGGKDPHRVCTVGQVSQPGFHLGIHPELGKGGYQEKREGYGYEAQGQPGTACLPRAQVIFVYHGESMKVRAGINCAHLLPTLI